MTSPLCEFLDPDGIYLLVRPLDEVRCRVIDSNVAPKGELLYKRSKMAWTRAAENLGGLTRLGPRALLESRSTPEGKPPTEDLGLLAEEELPLGEHRYADPEREFVDPRSERAGEDRPEAPSRRAVLVRLAHHYRKAHEYRDGGSRRLSRCECPGVAPTDPRIRGKLHALLSKALGSERPPTLEGTLEALQRALGRMDRVA